MKNEEPPLIDPGKFLFVWIISVVIVLIASVLFLWLGRVPKEEVSLKYCFLESHFQHYRNGDEIELQITKGEYLLAQSPPYLMNGRVYSTLMDRIIECESGGDSNAKNPHSTAYGLCQFIDGTWDYVQDKWDMKLDRKDEYDQRYACDRLLEEEDTDHWITTQWCWE